MPVEEVSKLVAANAPWSEMVALIDYDPRVMLYAPLHTVIWEDSDGRAWFTVDQPSTQFSSFGRPEISEVGRELDRKLANLLDGLSLDVPAGLRNDEAAVGAM